MTSRIPSLRGPVAALLAALAFSGPAQAQMPAYPALSTDDPVAALSRFLRMLAANPRDLASLTGAGRAALAVGDANAALGFYARAEEIAPRNGRIKAGLAAALVQMEQPRTALKLFDEAVALGVPVGDIASDRGLANDLNGDGRRAQADYTLALRAREDDETVRRLALSMAISGDRAGALTMLDPLLRKRDSGAIRARAFVLALTGDQSGAASAVRAAMPGPQAGAMSDFLARLTRLNPAQKALAVNFGYFPSDGRSYTAAELFADARSAPLPAVGALAARDARRDTPLIPAGAALGPRPALGGTGTQGNNAAPRRRPGQIEAIAEVPPPPHVLAAPTAPVYTRPPVAQTAPQTVVAAAAPRVLPPVLVRTPPPVTTPPVTTPLAATPTATPSTAPPPAETPVETIRVTPAPAARPPAARPASATAEAEAEAPKVVTKAPQIAFVGSSGVRMTAPAPAQAQVPPASNATDLPDTATRVAPEAPPATPGPVPSTPAPAAAIGAGAYPAVVVTAAGPALVSAAPDPVTTAGATPPPQPSPAAAQAPPSRIATVDLPASTPVSVLPPVSPRLAPTPEPALRDASPAGASAARVKPEPASSRKPVTPASKAAKADEPARAAGKTSPKSTKDKVVGTDQQSKSAPKAKGDPKEKNDPKEKMAKVDPKDKAATGKAEAARLAAAEKAEQGQSANKARSAGKAKTDKAAVDEAKAGKTRTADKARPETKPDSATTPERYWVQVASGSNKADLDKAWVNVKGKAPKLLDGKTTYTAPWRASNRLLIGPFQTPAEAQGQVNRLAKAGVSGIQFTTRAGTDVEKVTGK